MDIIFLFILFCAVANCSFMTGARWLCLFIFFTSFDSEIVVFVLKNYFKSQISDHYSVDSLEKV